MADVDVKQSRGKAKHSKKKAKRVAVRIDMTAMVDVAFLLLTFFILTSSMNKPQTMEINLPPTESKVEVAESNLLTLRITKDFVIFWSIGTEKPAKITFKELKKFLEDKNKQNSKLITLIKVDKKAKYINMVDIMDELNIAGVTRFSLAPMLEDDKKLIEKI